MCPALCWLLCLFGIVGVPANQAQNLLVNGSFEAPGHSAFVIIGAGETTLSPWVVGLSSVDLLDIHNPWNSDPAYDGTQYIDLDGTPGPGQLTQSFSTKPGWLYDVTFAYANNYFNVPSTSATVRVFDNLGNRLFRSFTHSTSGRGNLDWTVFSAQFLATQSTTSLEITSLSPAGSYVGILLDGIKVEVGTPPAPKVLSSYINQGTAQRSMIQGIGLTFDRDVSANLEAGFLKVRNIGTGATFDLSTATLVFDPRNFSATWMLDRNVAALLPDGNYIAWLEVDRLLPSEQTARFGILALPLDDYTFGFHQLAGDSDGDRDVDFLDAARLRKSWQGSLGQDRYQSWFDFNLNGTVAESDRAKIEPNFFTVLAEAPALHASLRNDTGDSQTDNLTDNYDVVVGIVGGSTCATLEARIDSGAFQNVTSAVVLPNTAIFSKALMDTMAGGPLTIAPHRLEVRAKATGGVIVATDVLDFTYLGVLNVPPYFTTTPLAGHSLGGVELHPYVYDSEAIDPEGTTVAYQLAVSANGAAVPNGASIDPSTGNLSWLPSAAGRYEFTIEARDLAGATARQNFFVQVYPNDLPPTVRMLLSDANPPINVPVSIQVIANDDIGISALQLFMDGTAVTLSSQGFYTTLFATTGIHQLRAVATDTFAHTTEAFSQFAVRDPSAPDAPGNGTLTGPGSETGSGIGPAPIVSITAPANTNDDLSKFFGTVDANGGTLNNWTLGYAPQTSVNLNNLADPAVAWTQFAIGTTAQNLALLGTLNLATLPNATLVFRLLAYNTNGKGAITSVIFNPVDTAIPVVVIDSPQPETSVSYLTQIRGTVLPNGGTLRNWALDYAPADQVNLLNLSDGTAWKPLATGTTAQNNAVLTTFDSTVLRNDTYVIRLLAYNTNGRGYAIPTVVNVIGDAKLGNFRLDFVDLTIPLNGIPIQIRRTYDTLTSSRSRDFGYGWTLDISDADLHETVPDTGSGFSATPFKVGTRVFITTPEGRRVGFTLQVRNPLSSFFFTSWEPYFQADPGVYETLSLPDPSLRLSIAANGSLVFPLFGFAWNPDDYLLTTKDGITYHYLQQSGLQDITDLHGNTVIFSPNSITHSSGESIQILRDALGRITRITGPDGNPISYAYNAAGDLTSVTDRANLQTTFTYFPSPAHYLQDIVDPLGRRAQRTEYGPDGRLVAITDSLNHRVEQAFDPANFTGTVTDTLGNVTTLVYNARGNLLEERKPEGGITRWEFNDAANPDKATAKVDPLGHRITSTYDGHGNNLTETDALGNVAVFTYNAFNKLTSLVRKDNTGIVLTTESSIYDADDAAGKIATLTDLAGHTRSFQSDSSGKLIGWTDFTGNHTTFDHTNGCGCGAPGTIIHADGTTSTFEYNRSGQVTKATDETGAVTRHTYDANGREIGTTDPDGHTTLFTYDAAGNQTTRTDRLGRITKFEYDARNRVVKEIKILTDDGNNTNDVVTSYEYDGDGHLTALVDPLGNRTQFAYDRDGRLKTRTDAAGAVATVRYDLAGNTQELIDRNGRKRSFLYDARNLPTAERWHDPADAIIRTISVTQDALRRRVSISDPDSTYTYQYDAASRVAQVSNAGSPVVPNVILDYTYDNDGRLQSVTDNAGVSVQTTFDSRGRSNTFAWSGGGIASASVDFDRNGRGQTTSIKRFNDGILTNLVSRTTIDQIASQGWTKQIQHRDAAGAPYTAGTNFTYGYDAEGQITAQTSLGNSTAYTYDPTGQLLTADHTAAAYPDETYTYDKAGNRTSSHLHAAYTTGPANRLQSDGFFNYTYDAEGDLTTRTEIASGKVTTLTYDHRGRVTSIIERMTAAGSILTQQQFTYDVMNRRITRNVNGTITHTAYHQENAWAEYDLTGTVTIRYLFADRIDGNLAKWTATNGTEWYLTDKLGSIRGLAAASGGLSTSTGYDSFGNNLTGGAIFDTERYGFTGREAVTTGLASYRSRIYNSQAGRFIGEDRLGFGGGDPNLYRYVFNTPTSLVDPRGGNALGEYGAVLNVVANGPAGYAIGKFIGALSGFGATNLLYLSATLEAVNTINTGLDGLSTEQSLQSAVTTLYQKLLVDFELAIDTPGRYGILCDVTSLAGLENPCGIGSGFNPGFKQGQDYAQQRLKDLGLIP